MTAQIPDQFLYEARPFALAGISEGELFDVTALGLRPTMLSTACWRGFQAVFAVDGGRLVLHALHVNLVKDDGAGRGFERLAGPVINGVTPTPGAGPYDMFNNHYEGVQAPVAYTGGVLVADGFLRELYVHMGFHPAWKYERVVELLFDRGALVAEHDRSDATREIRARMQRVERDGVAGATPTKDEVRAFVERSFDRRYRM